MTLETKHFALDELKTDDDTRSIEGFASIFGNVDSGNDIVIRGAFAKTLKKRQPVMLWQHNTNEPIGVWSEYEETEKGLRVKGTLADTMLGIDAYKLLKMGALKGLSIGYGTKKYEIDQDKGTRRLMELDLFEVSLVTFPMNERATITRVKAAHENEREFEEFLREAGYSRDAAKIITAKGFKALSGQREVEGEVQTPLQVQTLQDIARLFNHIRI